MSYTNHLLIFARVPKPGTNKTRLIPAVGAENATLVYRNLAERTLSRVRQLGSEKACLATVCFTGGVCLRLLLVSTFPRFLCTKPVELVAHEAHECSGFSLQTLANHSIFVTFST